jgi:EAL domain-containing protein (putative c-di-GMP-specific phosphodiesterase class I)
MDDFGTGFSSLTSLRSFCFDKIKIDGTFVRSVAQDPSARNLVRAVTGIAHGLGMATSAEGVETAEQLEIVRSEGCTEVQGFLFSPALAADEVDSLLAGTGWSGRKRGLEKVA